MQCKAILKRTGKRCGCPANSGTTVCKYHGGNAPQVKRKALERLALMADPALRVVDATMKQKRDRRLAWNAATDVLDRNDLTGSTKVDVTAQITKRVFGVEEEAV